MFVGIEFCGRQNNSDFAGIESGLFLRPKILQYAQNSQWS